MKILAFVDSHGSEKHMKSVLEQSHNADVIVCAGDFTIFEKDMELILKQLNSIGKPVILLHGNHENPASLTPMIANMKNIHFIHKSYYIIDDAIFFGYGGGGFATNDPRFDIVTDIFIKDLENLGKRNGKEYKFVLVTHPPPYGTALDYLGYHVGLINITKFLEKQQPELLICGHIHECFYIEQKMGNTLMINPGPKGKIIEV